MKVVYEDNHIIIIYKESGEIVQGDKTGDRPLSDIVKDYLKVKYQKPGNVFLGVAHRLDRPVSGLVVFAKTSKALTRLNKMFASGEVHKTYWAITSRPETLRQVLSGQEQPRTDAGEGEWVQLEHWLVRNEKQNKSYVVSERPRALRRGEQAESGSQPPVANAKKALLRYRVIGQGERYDLVEVELMTGRHHQIRCQLASVGRVIKGDLKYGARRSNPDGSISLLSHRVEFVHPVSKEAIVVTSPLPEDRLWESLMP